MQAEFDFRYATGETLDYGDFVEAQFRNFGLVNHHRARGAAVGSLSGCAARSRSPSPP